MGLLRDPDQQRGYRPSGRRAGECRRLWRVPPDGRRRTLRIWQSDPDQQHDLGQFGRDRHDGEDARGGGVFVRGTATIIGSTIEGNVADGDGGGLFKPIQRYCVDHNTTLAILDSTLSGNSAGGARGGFVSERPTTLANSTLAFNRSAFGGALMFRLANLQCDQALGTLDLESSILAGNLVGDAAPYAADFDADDTLAVTGANSLVMVAYPAITLPGDTLDADPLLLPLADNGGPTQTLALSAGSPAIDTGNNAAALDFDQRGDGYPRVVGAAADIGAFEVQPLPDHIFRNGFDP